MHIAVSGFVAKLAERPLEAPRRRSDATGIPGVASGAERRRTTPEGAGHLLAAADPRSWAAAAAMGRSSRYCPGAGSCRSSDERERMPVDGGAKGRGRGSGWALGCC